MEGLFAALEAPLLRYTFKLVHNPEASQDIVQEAFMKLHGQFHEVRQPKPWLFRTAHNLAVNHLRSGQKIVPLSFEGDGAEADPGDLPQDTTLKPDEHMARLETIEQTRHCLQSLDERSRELVQMKFLEDLSYKEMSRRTGLSVSNVGYILHHALKQLAAELENTGVTL
jgi:RNA polymerase sigma factor (sigma-70 family)